MKLDRGGVQVESLGLGVGFVVGSGLLLSQQSGAPTLIVTALGSCSSLPVRRSTADTAVLAAAAAHSTGAHRAGAHSTAAHDTAAHSHRGTQHRSAAIRCCLSFQGSSVCVRCQAAGQGRYQLVSTLVSKLNQATIKSASCIIFNVPSAFLFIFPNVPPASNGCQVAVPPLPETCTRLPFPSASQGYQVAISPPASNEHQVAKVTRLQAQDPQVTPTHLLPHAWSCS